jgi:hypothetical protein
LAKVFVKVFKTFFAKKKKYADTFLFLKNTPPAIAATPF